MTTSPMKLMMNGVGLGVSACISSRVFPQASSQASENRTPYQSHPNMKLTTAASTMANKFIPANSMALLRSQMRGGAEY